MRIATKDDTENNNFNVVHKGVHNLRFYMSAFKQRIEIYGVKTYPYKKD